MAEVSVSGGLVERLNKGADSARGETSLPRESLSKYEGLKKIGERNYSGGTSICYWM